jgi:uncharacterized protein (DUF58 family)
MNPRFWIPLLVLAVITGVLLRLEMLSVFAPVLMVLFGIVALWRRIALQKVTYERHFHFHRGFRGETIPVELQVENRKALPLLWLRITDPWPKQISPRGEVDVQTSHRVETLHLVSSFHLRWFHRVKRSLSLTLGDRGFYNIGPARISSGDFFGLAETTRENVKVDNLIVYPEMIDFRLPVLRTDHPQGELRSPLRIFEDPTLPYGIRDFHPMDDFRSIHWPATARSGSLQVKVYQPVTARIMMLCLNVSTTEYAWEGYNATLLEHLVKMSTTILYQAYQGGFSVGLISNGGTASGQPFHLAPGRSTRHLIRMLELLAAIQPLTVSRFETYLTRQLNSIPYGASLVLLTSTFSRELANALWRIRRYRKQMTILMVGDELKEKPAGLNIIHLPYTSWIEGKSVENSHAV